MALDLESPARIKQQSMGKGKWVREAHLLIW